MVQNENTKEISSLTGFRALAATMVWALHYGGSWFWVLLHGGSGVQFFFALSGFLFTVLYFNKRFDKKELSAYFIKRITRIYPTYWFVLGSVLLLNVLLTIPVNLSPPLSTVGFLLNALLLQTYFPSTVFMYLGQAWTLTVEELFYACFPLILLFIRTYCTDKNKSRINLLKVTVFLSGITLLEIQLWGQFVCFALGIMGGLLVIQYPQSKWIKDKRFNSLIGIAGITVFCLAVFWFGKKRPDFPWAQSDKQVLFLYSLAFGAAATLIILSLYGESWFRKVFENKVIVYCGKISFAFYLIHIHIIYYLREPLLSVITSNNREWHKLATNKVVRCTDDFFNHRPFIRVYL
jgi:peptidoglycan/LPS O-acetylase OafA/YrhL